MKSNQMSPLGVVITRLGIGMAAAVVVLVGLIHYHIDNAYLAVAAVLIIVTTARGIYLEEKNEKNLPVK
jgi:hypothetical protein